MTTHDDFDALLPVADALERLGVAYYVGGSVASSMHGVARSTIDIDIVAKLEQKHVAPMIGMLERDYYIDSEMMLSAIRRHASFNIIHFHSQYKIDIFVAKHRAFDQTGWQRIAAGVPFEASDREFPVASAEDVILNKLEWYRMGGGTSERQWLDILGVMKVQAAALDRDYLTRWAGELNVTELLERAWREASA